MQSDIGQFLIAKNIHPELSIWQLPSLLLVPLDSLHVRG